jgi:hypothetical protein
MKKNLLLLSFIVISSMTFAQNKTNKFGLNVGGYIQHYNGNLGNSLMQFKTTCFAGVSSNFGIYLNRSFDFNVSASVGSFGYCQTLADKTRIVALEYRCPGCTDGFGMGELRSLMISSGVSMKYKFSNGYFLKEDSKFSPYIGLGAGINHLSDNMKKQCVNVGYHFSVNSSVGIVYNITNKINIGYSLNVSCFTSKKVYASNGISEEPINDGHNDEDSSIEKRKDIGMQNTFFIGFNF